MKFDLVRPCPECPFSTLPGAVRLGRARVIEILQAVTLQDASFPCHQTVDYDQDDDDEGDGRVTPASQHCAGALIYLERLDRPNQMMRIAERLGFYDRTRLGDLWEQPVITSQMDMIEPREGRRGQEA